MKVTGLQRQVKDKIRRWIERGRASMVCVRVVETAVADLVKMEPDPLRLERSAAVQRGDATYNVFG